MANIQLTKEQQQYLVLAVLVLGGGGYAYFKYFWMPTSQKIVELSKKVEEVEGKINRAKMVAARKKKVVAELETLKRDAEDAERRLPKSQDLPLVIDTVSALSSRHNVALSSFAPGARTDRQHFLELSYGVQARGAYHDIGRFLAALALEERIFNVRDVNMGSPDAQGRLTLRMTLVSYQYKG